MKSNFTAILTLCVLMIIGAALIPKIDVSNEPRPEQGKTLNIRFDWPGANAKVVEQNATSRIEGLVASVAGVDNVSSISRFGGGEVTVVLKKEADVSSVKFEIASLIKNTYKKLPQKVTYPFLSGGEVVRSESFKDKADRVLEYQINANKDNEQILEYVKTHVKPVIEKLDGVHDVYLRGGTSKYIEISYDPNKVISCGITPNDVANAIQSYLGTECFVGDVITRNKRGDKIRRSLYLATSKEGKRLEDMPIKTVDNSVISLNNLATFEYKHELPESYYRVNGMNTIYLTVNREPDANMMNTSSRVKETVEKFNADKKNGLFMSVVYDEVEVKMKDLTELVWQSLISLAILLVFVWLTKREWKYLVIISVTLMANILLAVIAYWFFDIRLHPYSLAGITVSLGLIIDASIVMTDHYSYYRNRKSALAITAALLTTVGALIVIFFMPEQVKHDLKDFTWVVIINLTLALLVAIFFVPALVDSLSYNSKNISRIPRKRMTMGWKRFYSGYVRFTQRFKWIYIVLLIMAFGIPFYALPDKVGAEANPYVQNVETKWYEDLYNNTLGSRFFQMTLKGPLSNIFGGSMRLFANSLNGENRYKRPDDKILYIRAQMPLGGTAAELNEKVEILEQFLSKFKEIKRFETQVSQWGAYIQVEFTDEAKNTGFPYILERKVIGKVITIGGADWMTYGISERGFSNSLNLSHRQNHIKIAGYDYDRLYRYAEDIVKKLRKNNRVQDIVIKVPDESSYYGDSDENDEFFMQYDREKLALYNVSLPYVYYSLQGLLSSHDIGRYEDENMSANVKLSSVMNNKFDLWQLQNSYIKVGDTDMHLSNFMDISRRVANNKIPKKNQEYILSVDFNILGSYTYINNYMQEITQELNAKFPVGFRCLEDHYWGRNDESTQYWLILLVVTIIFFLCAILFESLRLPLVIIVNIPISLIGTFLVFYFTGVDFGSGGFASLVLLCGLVVNSGIYILNEYRNMCNAAEKKGLEIDKLRLYVKAYNHKIVPVFLTTISTMMGLLPFLMYAEHQKFWFSFAVGSLGGLLFSIISLVFVMPIFMKLHLNFVPAVKGKRGIRMPKIMKKIIKRKGKAEENITDN